MNVEASHQFFLQQHHRSMECLPIADAAQSRHLGELTYPVLRERVTAILTVSDAELVETMRFFVSRMKIVVEPTGCLGAAAVFAGKIDVAGKRVGVVLSGGNVDPAVLLQR